MLCSEKVSLIKPSPLTILSLITFLTITLDLDLSRGLSLTAYLDYSFGLCLTTFSTLSLTSSSLTGSSHTGCVSSYALFSTAYASSCALATLV